VGWGEGGRNWGKGRVRVNEIGKKRGVRVRGYTCEIDSESEFKVCMRASVCECVYAHE